MSSFRIMIIYVAMNVFITSFLKGMAFNNSV